MSGLVLENLLSNYRDKILAEMKIQMDQRLRSNFREFLLESAEGQRRMPKLINLMIRAAGGDDEPFFEDQEEIGYRRAVEGVKLNDMCHVFHAFREVCYGVLRDSVPEHQAHVLEWMDRIYKLGTVLFEGYVVVSRSYMRSREEQINDKVTILQKLHDFAQQLIVTFEPEAIVNLVEREISALFHVQAFVTIFSDYRITGAFGRQESQMAPELAQLITKSWTESSTFIVSEQGEVFTEVEKCVYKRIVSVPIRAHGRAYGVLALFDPDKGFEFTGRELHLLNQFIYLMALSVENALMVEEIEQSRQQLRLITDKLLTIREQERRRLAADIHDTLAQTLTGIGYKIGFCAELVHRMPERAANELERLIDTVNGAVVQCRDLISSLRPDLIDTLGLIPALRRLFDTFFGATGIRVEADLPMELELPPDVSICLYRVAQEALNNIYKHAGVRTASVRLTERDHNVILVVSDNGRGFDISSRPPWMANPNKWGLLYTKERVESVGGTLAIDSEVNRGCTMEAKVPLRLEEVSHD